MSSASRKSERVLLPRTLDPVWDLLDLLHQKAKAKDAKLIDKVKVLIVVIDFSDAFFQIPLGFIERRFAVVQFRGKYYVFTRAPQGSRGAPLLWSRVCALCCRLALATCSQTTTRINAHVDDPEIAAVGTEAENNRALTKIIISWLAIGLKLAFNKAAIAEEGSPITWTSSKQTINNFTVTAEVKEEIARKVRDEVNRFLKTNVISLVDFRAFLGRCVCVAGLLHVWRPFVAMMWAPLNHPESQGSAPPGCLWRPAVDILFGG